MCLVLLGGNISSQADLSGENEPVDAGVTTEVFVGGASFALLDGPLGLYLGRAGVGSPWFKNTKQNTRDSDLLCQLQDKDWIGVK